MYDKFAVENLMRYAIYKSKLDHDSHRCLNAFCNLKLNTDQDDITQGCNILLLVFSLAFLLVSLQCDTESDQDDKVSCDFFHILLNMLGSFQASFIEFQ